MTAWGKGQAAFEFLLTYGWALLAVLTSVGALAYFGLLTPAAFLPERCDIVVEFACTDFYVSKSAVTLELLNTLGEEATIESISIIDPETIATVCRSDASATIKNGEKTTQQISCTSFPWQEGTKAKMSIRIAYHLSIPDFSHALAGGLYAVVHEGPALPRIELPPTPTPP